MKARHILYIEDNALVREITCEMLNTDANEVTAVASAEDALAELRGRRFDVIITDISLPAMSGVAFARRILAMDPTAPIIIASAYDWQEDLGVAGARIRVLKKPFDAAQIESLIGELHRPSTA
jgi:CheY-like chemotaxis protein